LFGKTLDEKAKQVIFATCKQYEKNYEEVLGQDTPLKGPELELKIKNYFLKLNSS
jgi:hypothetical protein